MSADSDVYRIKRCLLKAVVLLQSISYEVVAKWPNQINWSKRHIVETAQQSNCGPIPHAHLIAVTLNHSRTGNFMFPVLHFECLSAARLWLEEKLLSSGHRVLPSQFKFKVMPSNQKSVKFWLFWEFNSEQCTEHLSFFVQATQVGSSISFWRNPTKGALCAWGGHSHFLYFKTDEFRDMIYFKPEMEEQEFNTVVLSVEFKCSNLRKRIAFTE